MNREALTQLVRVLEAVPSDRFDMRTWTAPWRSGECGFAGCAAGWAGQDKWFNDQGFTCGVNGPRLDGRGQSWLALEKMFDIRDTQAVHLFCPSSYRTGGTTRPAAVIKRVEALLVEVK